MSSKAVLDYLTDQRNSSLFADDWNQLSVLYSKKLWHQLTLFLYEFLPKLENGKLELYEKLIKTFEERLNPISLVQIVLIILKECTDIDSKLLILQELKEKIRLHPEAKCLCLSSLASLFLNKGCADDSKEKLLEAEDILEQNNLEVGLVHAYYYEISSKYYQLTSQHAKYYLDTLRYLGCKIAIKNSNSDMTLTENDCITESLENDQHIAYSISIAALIAEGVYNFGEILLHPILAKLNDLADKKWIIVLIEAFNRGDLSKFDQLRNIWETQPDLKSNESILIEKIRLLSLMELTFQRPATKRALSFELISQTARISLKEVEILVMRAFSLELVRGSIDEVENIVHMTWVQPRVLELSQLNSMKDQIVDWSKKIKSTCDLVEDQVSGDLLV